LLKPIPITGNDFVIEPEIAIKLAECETMVFEVPISFLGLTYQEGKKIGLRDGLRALLAMLRHALSDYVYCVTNVAGASLLGCPARRFQRVDGGYH
jgi:hypothetical protein